MIRFLLFLTALFSCVSLWCEEIYFERPFRTGSAYYMEIQLKTERAYTFQFPGPGKPIEKRESVEAVFLGKVEIERVDDAGNPLILLIETKVAGGSVNGRKVPSGEIVGKTIRADLSKYPCSFAFKDKTALSENSIVFLASIFRYAEKEGTAVFLGKKRTYKAGETWRPEVRVLLDKLEKRGIRMKENEINAVAKFERREKINGTDCVTVAVECSSKNNFTEDFRFHTTFILPVDPEDGGYLRTVRTGTEVVDWHTEFPDPAASGSSIRVMTTEKLTATMVPAKSGHRRLF